VGPSQCGGNITTQTRRFIHSDISSVITSSGFAHRRSYNRQCEVGTLAIDEWIVAFGTAMTRARRVRAARTASPRCPK